MERCRVEIAKTSYMYSRIRDYVMEEDFDDGPIEGIPAPLTWPLKEIGIAFLREEDFYSGTVQIVPSRGTDFSGLSDRIHRGAPNGIWKPTSSYGTGYIVEKGEPIFSIIKNDSYWICMGHAGACPRKFNSVEEFNNDMSQLEKVVNLFMKSAYNFVGKAMRLPDVVYLEL